VTIAKRPSDEAGREKLTTDLGEARSEIFLARRLDDPNQLEKRDELAVLAQRDFQVLSERRKHSETNSTDFGRRSRITHLYEMKRKAVQTFV
jgi:hypothetical protein